MSHTVAYLGPEKTNTHFAAKKKFGPKYKYIHVPTVEDVFDHVEMEKALFGVVPVENSLEGVVTRTLDRFASRRLNPVQIYGEIEQPIQHCLIFRAETSLEKLGIIYSHPQALAQCRPWLDSHYPRAHRRERESTADAVRDLLDEKEKFWSLDERAAIGRQELAREHGLKWLPIPVDEENITRFIILSLESRSPRPGRRNKTSLMFSLKDKPGALHDALVPLKTHGINLTKIESRPTKRKAWEYVFFVDLEGHRSELRIKKALAALERRTSDLRVLGSYPLHAS